MDKIETKVSLKDCPFCGGTAGLFHWGQKGRIVKCTGCLVQKRQKVLRYSTDWLEELLIREWNERVNDTQ